MNIIAHALSAIKGEPDPRAVASGMTVVRVGRGRYQYGGLHGGLPDAMKNRKRRPLDAVDLALCAAFDAQVQARPGTPEPSLASRPPLVDDAFAA